MDYILNKKNLYWEIDTHGKVGLYHLLRALVQFLKPKKACQI